MQLMQKLWANGVGPSNCRLYHGPLMFSRDIRAIDSILKYSTL